MLEVCVDRLIAVYSTPHILLEYPDGNRYQLVVLHFSAKATGGKLNISHETTEARYFSQAEAERLDMGDLDRLRIDDGFAAQTMTFIR